MVNYDFLKAIPQRHFLEMVRRGIIHVKVMDWLVVYEFYLNELKSNKKSVSVTYTSEKYNCSEKTILRIINFMIN
jgi:hypothetical protein